MGNIKDVLRIRKYEKDGEEKTAFDKVGILITKPDGSGSIHLDTMPVGPWDGWLIYKDKRAKGEAQSAPDEISDIEPF